MKRFEFIEHLRIQQEPIFEFNNDELREIQDDALKLEAILIPSQARELKSEK